MSSVFSVVGTFIVLVALAADARAQGVGPCLPHADAVAKLEGFYGERLAGVGVGDKGVSVAELFVAESGTWTILITRTTGISCVAASGDGWTHVPLVWGEAS